MDLERNDQLLPPSFESASLTAWCLRCWLASTCLGVPFTNANAQENEPVIHLESVLESVTSQYPPYLAALIERDIAQGHLRSAQGSF
jgi:hypothetical protein